MPWSSPYKQRQALLNLFVVAAWLHCHVMHWGLSPQANILKGSLLTVRIWAIRSTKIWRVSKSCPITLYAHSSQLGNKPEDSWLSQRVHALCHPSVGNTDLNTLLVGVTSQIPKKWHSHKWWEVMLMLHLQLYSDTILILLAQELNLLSCYGRLQTAPA